MVIFMKAYYFDTNSIPEADFGARMTVKSVQGIVNRNAPILFLLGGNVYYQDTDINWKKYYESKGYEFEKLNSYIDVIKKFAAEFKGIVTYSQELKEKKL
jgi:hypothetical protein